jgi:hypothetical protein
MVRIGIFTVIALLLSCTIASPQRSQAPDPVTAPATPAPMSSLLFSVGTTQARLVATTVAFFDAFNAGQVNAAVGLTTSDVVGGDCDPRTGRPRLFGRSNDFSAWLRERAAEHERYTIERIANENPDAVTGGRVVAVGFLNRTNDVLAAMGRPEGITPSQGAKIVFTPDGTRIVALNLPCQ